MGSGWGETLVKQSQNILLQLEDDQRSLLLRRRLLSSAGKGDGMGARPCGWNGIGLCSIVTLTIIITVWLLIIMYYLMFNILHMLCRTVLVCV